MQILRKTNLNGYKQALSLGPKKVIDFIKTKNIVGRGGAAFPTGLKWQFVYNNPGTEKFVICNADEGEPGTFKDRFILVNNPDLVIEGILIASYVINAKKAFIYLRGEYENLIPEIKKSIQRVKNKTKANIEIQIVLGAGAYVCGEETAIMESIEGNRPHVREKPPFPTKAGLYNKPTLLNNVETLADVALSLAFDDCDVNLKLFSLSGNVSKPGVYELPSDVRLSKLIKLGEPKHKIKAVYFGCFGGCVPYYDIELTTENVCRLGAMLGSGTIIAVDEKHSIPNVATNIAKFYEFESCGKCTPCREGTKRILEILERITLGKGKLKDLDALEDISDVMRETSACGLGKSASNHLVNALKFFRNEFEDLIK